MDTGQAHLAANETDPNIIAGLNQLNAPSLPVYQITGCKVNGVAVTYVTTDPGKALSTGLCSGCQPPEGPHPPRPRRPRPLLPQRLRRHARPGRQLLQRPLPNGPQPGPEDRPRQLPQRAVNLLRFQLTTHRLKTRNSTRPIARTTTNSNHPEQKRSQPHHEQRSRRVRHDSPQNLSAQLGSLYELASRLLPVLPLGSTSLRSKLVPDPSQSPQPLRPNGQPSSRVPIRPPLH